MERRSKHPPHPLDPVGLAFLSAEERIALVDRSTPQNARVEIERLVKQHAAGRRLRPAFTYAACPELVAVRRGLERLAREACAEGPLGELHAARAEELELEARMVECVGTPDFEPLAARRFREPDAALSGRVTAFIDQALAEPTPRAEPETHASDDETSPHSLVRKLRRQAAELGLPVRIEIRPRQLATAATGRGVVAVRPGVLLTAESASRIVVHELVAHALPRVRSALFPLTLLCAGTARSAEHEEGRALLVEARTGHLGRLRRRELALRHFAAVAVRRGADFEEAVRELVGRQTTPRQAVEIAARAYRGGGLAREIVYLPAFFEIEAAFAQDPGLERWFERGRVGLEAARKLASLESATDGVSSRPSPSVDAGA